MKKILTLAFTFLLILLNVKGVQAQELSEKSMEGVTLQNDLEKGLTEEQKNTLNTYQRIFLDNGLYNEFTIDEKGNMLSEKSFESMQVEYGLLDEDLTFIKDIINTNNNSVVQQNKGITPRMHVEGFRVYLSYSEAKSYLGGAVALGPVAITGALAALGATVGGPIGAVVCGVAGLYGASYISTVYQRAQAQHRGVWIGWGGIGIN